MKLVPIGTGDPVYVNPDHVITLDHTWNVIKIELTNKRIIRLEYDSNDDLTVDLQNLLRTLGDSQPPR